MKVDIYMRSGNVIRLRKVKDLTTRRNQVEGQITSISWEIKKPRRNKIHNVEPGQIEAIVIRKPWWDR